MSRAAANLRWKQRAVPTPAVFGAPHQMPQLVTVRSFATKRVMRKRPDAIKVTEAGAARIKELLDKREEPALGIRLGVRSRGCNGLTYTMDYCETKEKFMEEVEKDGVKVFIEPKAMMFVVGSTMDFVDDRLRSEFVFTNPNSKGECGCGESFNVD